MTKIQKNTHQGVAIKEKLHLPIAGLILHLLQTFANVDIVVDQIGVDISSREVRKGYPIRPVTSLS